MSKSIEQLMSEKKMDFVYRDHGVQSKWSCPHCSRHMTLHIEVDYPYLICPSAKCGKYTFLKHHHAKEVILSSPDKAADKFEEAVRQIRYHMMFQGLRLADMVSRLPETKTERSEIWLTIFRGLEEDGLKKIKMENLTAQILGTKLIQRYLYAPNAMSKEEFARIKKARRVKMEGEMAEGETATGQSE